MRLGLGGDGFGIPAGSQQMARPRPGVFVVLHDFDTIDKDVFDTNCF
jgi:hypothetical protein